jgi:hypothetical protein
VQAAVRLFLVFFGFAFVLLGFWMGVTLAGESRGLAERAASFTPSDAAAVAAAAPGTSVLVEGAVSPRNPERFRDFVAYVRQEFRGADNNGDEKWEVDETILPRLLIETGGTVQLANEGYELAGSHERWREEGLEWDRRAQEGTKRYTGLVAGRPVMVLGVVLAGREANEVVAELVFAGTRDEFVALQQSSAGWLPAAGLAVGLLGAAVIYLGAWGLRRWR